VIGIGNPDRGDDGAGRAVARLLRDDPPPGVELIEQDGEVSSLLACFDGVPVVYLIDACLSGAPAGAVHRFDATAEPLPQDMFSLSTHGMGLAEAIELARSLGQLPERCIVYAIEGLAFAPGTPLSPPVVAAIAGVGDRIRAEIDGVTPPRSRP
jgi:hydrogenase maturation protease